MIKLPFLKKDEDTLEEKRQAAEEKALRKQQIEEAAFYATMIPNSLARLRIASITKKDGKLDINKVKIKPPVLIHEDYYMIEINTARLPFGVKLEHLRDEQTLLTLSGACRTPIEAKFTPTEGFWYLVPRRGGLGIIPRIIDYEAVVDLMPASSSIWSFPIGVGENRKLTWIDLRKTPHMMIIGSTGTGKTVFLKNMIFTLALNCSPKRLRFVVCDFKRGPDFKALAELPHLGTPLPVRHKDEVVGLDEETGSLETERTSDYMDRILIHLDEILATLKWGRNEIDRRNAMFDEDVTNIDQWNAKYRKRPLPHVVIIIDEIGVIMNRLSAKDANKLTEYLADIAMLGRSAGLHLVLGLQKLVKKVLDGAISDNIEARIVGLCASGSQSAIAMGNGSWAAARLPKIKGRAMWRDEHGEVEVQLPWVAPKTAVDLTNQVINKWVAGDDNEDQLAMDIFKWCLENHNGDYHINQVYQHWRGEQVTKAQVQTIREDYLVTTDDDGTVGNLFKIEGVEHVLIPGIPGQRPSRVVTLERYSQVMNPDEPTEAAMKPGPDPKEGVEAEELFRYALDHLDGDFPIKEIHSVFADRISRNAIEAISKQYETDPIEIDGQTYVLEKQGGRKPKKLASRIPNPESQAPKPANSNLGDDLKTDISEENTDPDLIDDEETIQAELLFIDEDEPEDDQDFETVPDWLQPVVDSSRDEYG